MVDYSRGIPQLVLHPPARIRVLTRGSPLSRSSIGIIYPSAFNVSDNLPDFQASKILPRKIRSDFILMRKPSIFLSISKPPCYRLISLHIRNHKIIGYPNQPIFMFLMFPCWCYSCFVFLVTHIPFSVLFVFSFSCYLCFLFRVIRVFFFLLLIFLFSCYSCFLFRVIRVFFFLLLIFLFSCYSCFLCLVIRDPKHSYHSWLPVLNPLNILTNIVSAIESLSSSGISRSSAHSEKCNIKNALFSWSNPAPVCSR